MSWISALALAYLLILFLKSGLALLYAARYSKPTRDLPLGQVTICQPILSGDPQLEQVLADNLRALPTAAFLWLIDADDAEGQAIGVRLVRSHPQHAIRIMRLPPAPPGINPKLFKLEAGRVQVQTPVLLVLDDDTRLPAASLQALLAALDEVELATGLPFYRDGANLFSSLLGQFVNNNSAQTYLPLLPFAGPVSINGMCYALRLATLNRLQGFQTILRHLTDDLAMADLVRMHGGRICQTPLPQEVTTTIANGGQYLRQMHRWFLFATLLMRRQSGPMNVLIAVLHGVPPLLLMALLALAGVTHTGGALLALGAVLLLRAGCLCWVQYRISGQVRHRPGLSLLSELLQPLHLAHAACWRLIRWRSRSYYVFDNDRFESR